MLGDLVERMMFPLNKVKILLLYFMVFVAGVFDAR